MEIREEMAKFRYNLNRFQSSMTEYEQIMGVANQMRARQRTDELGGTNPKKWDNPISEKDSQAATRLAEAEEAYLSMKSLLFAPKKSKAKD